MVSSRKIKTKKGQLDGRCIKKSSKSLRRKNKNLNNKIIPLSEQ